VNVEFLAYGGMLSLQLVLHLLLEAANVVLVALVLAAQLQPVLTLQVREHPRPLLLPYTPHNPNGSRNITNTILEWVFKNAIDLLEQVIQNIKLEFIIFFIFLVS